LNGKKPDAEGKAKKTVRATKKKANMIYGKKAVARRGGKTVAEGGERNRPANCQKKRAS